MNDVERSVAVLRVNDLDLSVAPPSSIYDPRSASMSGVALRETNNVLRFYRRNAVTRDVLDVPAIPAELHY